MNLFKDQLDSVTFTDVVAFCGEGHREGWQLDYKREIPHNGLAKFFAAFSNTRGGLIILGVEEDRQTGLPNVWDGVVDVAHTIERIHQMAATVDPKPVYEVHTTNMVGDRAFILIRVSEGAMTPYYVQNDPRVYVRTGNITPSVDIASPEMLELLVGKKHKAEALRNLRLNELRQVFQASMRKGEQDRLNKIAIEKQNYEIQSKRLLAEGKEPPVCKSRYYSKKLGSEASICEIILQPYYPQTVLMSPSEIKRRILEIRDGDGKFYINYPSLNPQSVQGGVMTFEWGENDGQIKFELVNSYGLFALNYDVLRTDSNKAEKLIHLSHPTFLMFHLLKAASNFYKMCGYQGGLVGSLSVEGTEGISLNPEMSRSSFLIHEVTGLMPRYEIPLELDTSIINDNKSLQEFFVQKVKEFYWTVGYGDIQEKLIENLLQKHRWLAT